MNTKTAMQVMALTAAAISLGHPFEEAGYSRHHPQYPQSRKGHTGVARQKRAAKKRGRA